MGRVVGYHRPSSLDQALSLLDAPGPRRVLLAGGTVVNTGDGTDPFEVVDLQAVGLSGIAETGDGLRIGATTTLQDLADEPLVPEVLADLARRELPSTLRSLATVGGTIATGDPDSELLAGLLVHEAVVTITNESGESAYVLAEVLAMGSIPGIITAVSIETGGTTAAARTGRTPGDRPIVAAVARRTRDRPMLLALCGVATTPIIVDDLTTLDPPDDFRGSAAYRRHLARVLSARVTAEVS